MGSERSSFGSSFHSQSFKNNVDLDRFIQDFLVGRLFHRSFDARNYKNSASLLLFMHHFSIHPTSERSVPASFNDSSLTNISYEYCKSSNLDSYYNDVESTPFEKPRLAFSVSKFSGVVGKRDFSQGADTIDPAAANQQVERSRSSTHTSYLSSNTITPSPDSSSSNAAAYLQQERSNVTIPSIYYTTNNNYEYPHTGSLEHNISSFEPCSSIPEEVWEKF